MKFIKSDVVLLMDVINYILFMVLNLKLYFRLLFITLD